MSIWHGVNRKNFEASVTALHSIGGSHRPSATDAYAVPKRSEASSEDTQPYTLPLEVEKQICDDIAFLAAAQNSSDCVTGATLEEGAMGVTFVLAANTGIPARATEVLGEVFQLLQNCAHCSIHKEECVSQSLDLLLSLHEERIRDRLGLQKSSTSKWRPWHNSISVSFRLDEMVKEGTRNESAVARSTLLLEIRELKQTIDTLVGEPRSNLKAIRDVVEVAARISKRDNTLPQKLIEAGFPAEYAQRNEIRRIKSLANYHHCCKYLCSAARTYRNLFRSIRLIPLTPYAVETCPIQSRHRHYVHAEIQLLVYHEMHLSSNYPRYIGVSKRACFLCYCFIRGYGVYAIPDTHGQIHPQWTVPDLKDYSKSTRTRIRDAIRRTRNDVEFAVTEARKTNTRKGLQIQSPSHSYAASLKTASASTIHFQSNIGSILHLDENLFHDESVKIFGSLTETLPKSSESETASYSESVHRTFELHEEANKTEMIKPDISSILDADWLTVYLPVYGAGQSYPKTAEDRSKSNSMNSFICQGKRILEESICTDVQVINVANLDVGQRLSFHGGASNQLDVLFTYAGLKNVAIRLTRDHAMPVIATKP